MKFETKYRIEVALRRFFSTEVRWPFKLAFYLLILPVFVAASFAVGYIVGESDAERRRCVILE